MYCGLYLRHLCAPTDHQCQAFVHMVAVAKTQEELRAWMESLRVEPYQEAGPAMTDGMEKVYTKHFARGSKLEWYDYPESLEMNDDRVDTGFVDVPTYEEFQAEIDIDVKNQTMMLQAAMRDRLDHYRNNIEPKMVSYNDSKSRTAIQRSN